MSPSRPRDAVLPAVLAASLLLAGPAAAQSGGEPGDGPGAEAAAPGPDSARSGTPPGLEAALSARMRAAARPAPSWSPWITRGAGFAMLVASDVGMRTAVQDLRSDARPPAGEGSFGDEVTEFGNGLGAWKTSLPWIAAGSLGVGAAVDGTRGAGRGLSILGGIAAGSMASQALNRAVGRSRPVWGDGAFSFDPFSGHASFPSGHVSFAFSVAGGVDAVTDGWLPAAAAYGLAGTTAFARLYDDKHWLSDVVVGAVLSATVSRLATHRTMELLGVAGEARDGGAAGSGRTADGGTGARGDTGADGSRAVRARLLFTPSLLGVRLRF